MKITISTSLCSFSPLCHLYSKVFTVTKSTECTYCKCGTRQWYSHYSGHRLLVILELLPLPNSLTAEHLHWSVTVAVKLGCDICEITGRLQK